VQIGFQYIIAINAWSYAYLIQGSIKTRC